MQSCFIWLPAKLQFHTSKSESRKRSVQNTKTAWRTEPDASYSAAECTSGAPSTCPSVSHMLCVNWDEINATLPTCGSNVFFEGHLSVCLPGTSCSTLAGKPRRVEGKPTTFMENYYNGSHDVRAAYFKVRIRVCHSVYLYSYAHLSINSTWYQKWIANCNQHDSAPLVRHT